MMQEFGLTFCRQWLAQVQEAGLQSVVRASDYGVESFLMGAHEPSSLGCVFAHVLKVDNNNELSEYNLKMHPSLRTGVL
jgi:hypothetical protein